MEYLVLCPGSRSGPLALAAAVISEQKGLTLITSIDERSAAFLALGIGTSTGKAAGLITTSGTAVANLLPASVEADRSCQPILLLTADRPDKYKNCGANQTVNQEDFLKDVCRSFFQAPIDGLHSISKDEMRVLVDSSWSYLYNPSGPVHINIPFDEPLCPSKTDQKKAIEEWKSEENDLVINNIESTIKSTKTWKDEIPSLDISSPGLIVIGHWRGNPLSLLMFNNSLKKYSQLTGWPIIADPLSGLDNSYFSQIYYWDLLLSYKDFTYIKDLQVLRLGPMPSSRTLGKWLEANSSHQVLITEGDSRPLDPFGIANQSSIGFVNWAQYFLENKAPFPSEEERKKSKTLFDKLIRFDRLTDNWLDKKLISKGKVTEPNLARMLSRLLPSDVPVMLSASSPIRDWATYSGANGFKRRCFGFRGASGIDGTLSLGMGLSSVIGTMFLITGDLSLLHDSNGWLFAKNSLIKLIVILIDNGGGGIFHQVDIDNLYVGEFDQIFTMPQEVSYLKLAESFGVPYRQVSCLEDIEPAMDWALSLSQTVLIRVCTDSLQDTKLRIDLKQELLDYLANS